MKKITIQWSYPMELDKILHDKRMGDMGIYYITRTFGGKTSDLYIGKTTYTFGSRLESHARLWLPNYRGKKEVRLGYLVWPKLISLEEKKRLINDAEMTMIWLMRSELIHNKQCMKDCYPTSRLRIKNIGYRGNLPAKMGFSDEEWEGETHGE